MVELKNGFHAFVPLVGLLSKCVFVPSIHADNLQVCSFIDSFHFDHSSVLFMKKFNDFKRKYVVIINSFLLLFQDWEILIPDLSVLGIDLCQGIHPLHISCVV